MGKTTSNFYNTNHLIKLIKPWYKHIIIASVVTIILSLIFSSSYFITPLYKSTLTMFPSSTNSMSKVLFSINSKPQDDILDYGEDIQTEQMLQILSSNKIRDKVVRRFNLMKHYNIDTTSYTKQSQLVSEFKSKIKFQRTNFMAVVVTVYDKDPIISALIANSIAELYDSTKNEIQKERAEKALSIVEQEYLKLQTEIAFLEDSLNIIRQKGIYDYESQSEMFNQQLAIEVARGNNVAIKKLEDKLSVLAEFGGKYVSIRNTIENCQKQLFQIKIKYEEAKVDATEFLPQKFIIDSAYKSDIKAYPNRVAILIISLISVLAISLAIIMFIEKQKSK